MHFSDIILNKDALQMRRHNLWSKRLNYVNLQKDPLPNNIWRKLAYGLFTSWINSWTSLGKGRRIVLPACAVSRILLQFPLEPGQERMGFIVNNYEPLFFDDI